MLGNNASQNKNQIEDLHVFIQILLVIILLIGIHVCVLLFMFIVDDCLVARKYHKLIHYPLDST